MQLDPLGKLFKVRVPAIATYSDAELEFMGAPINVDIYGKPMVEHNEMSLVYLSARRIVEIANQGEEVRLVNTDDLLPLFELLDKYLSNTTKTISVVSNLEADTNEFIKQVRKFIGIMYGNNKLTLDDKRKDEFSGFNLGLTTMETVKRESVNVPRAEPIKIKKTEEPANWRSLF